MHPRVMLFCVLWSLVDSHTVDRGLLPRSASGFWPSAEFNIVDYGAVADNFTLNTDAIQRAISAAGTAPGGGFVVVPGVLDVPGTAFRTGALRLLSNVYLYLAKGASLQASNRIEDYPDDWDDWDIIHAENVSNVGIVGEGSLSSISGPMWQMIAGYDPVQNLIEPVTWEGQKGCAGYECRPRGLAFIDAQNITNHNFHLKDSADWSSLYRRCSHVSITNMSISGALNWPNNDGIDLESGFNISLSHLDISTGDDGIVFASGNTNNLNHPWPETPPYSPLHLVRVRDCVICSHSSAIKVEAIFQKDHGDIFDIVVDQIVIVASNRGLGFQVRTGRGRVHDLVYSNILIETIFITGTNWWGAAEPIWMTAVPEDSFTEQAGLGAITNVTFVNILARSESGVLLSARDQPQGGISNVSMSSVWIYIEKFGNVSRPMHDFRPVDPSVPTQPTYNSSVDGFYFERVTNVDLINCGVVFVKPLQSFFGQCKVVTKDSDVAFQSFNCRNSSKSLFLEQISDLQTKVPTAPSEQLKT